VTQREALLIHAEVKALQQQLGLSYKDAAHHLYLAEVERLQLANSAAKLMTFVRQRIDKISQELYSPINCIDAGDFDDYVLMDRMWKKKEQNGETGGPSSQ